MVHVRVAILVGETCVRGGAVTARGCVELYDNNGAR